MSEPLKFGQIVWVDNDPSRRGVIAADAVAEDGARFVAYPSGYQRWERPERLSRPGDEKGVQG